MKKKKRKRGKEPRGSSLLYLQTCREYANPDAMPKQNGIIDHVHPLPFRFDP
jgi:hypothetical protein